MASGGVKPCITYGATDAYGYNNVDADGIPNDPFKQTFSMGALHVHDFHATFLHQLGIDHTRLSHTY